MKKAFFTVVAVLAMAVAGVIATPDESSATPTFARQTNQACNACHFQYFPKLNAYGRAFKLGGFTDASVDLIEDDTVSIPATMPVSFVTKLRYVKTDPKTSPAVDAGTDKGEWQVPDEAVIFLGGRANENVGYLIEWTGEWANGKVLIPFYKGDVTAGLTVFSTDGHGPGVSQELFNTGILRGQRAFEMRKESSIAQKMGYGTRATGLGVYLGGDLFFATASLWAPYNTAVDTGFDLSTYYRAAFTPNVGDMDLMVGIFGTAGETKCVNCESASVETTKKTESFGVDAQLQGEVGGMTLEVQAMYLVAGGDAPSDANTSRLFTKSNGYSGSINLGFHPKAGASVAYSSYTDESGASDVDTEATVVGLWYMLAQNISIRPEYAFYSNDGRSNDSQLLFMLFAGF